MKESILIVEDEALIALSLKERIEDLGYTVSGIVDKGEDVLPQLDTTAPDLILMDIMLSGKMDGIEAASTVSESEHDVPVIFLSSYSNNDILDRAKKTHPYGYMVKTIDDNNLHITLDMALNKHKSEWHKKNKKEVEIKKLNSFYENSSNLILRISTYGKVIYANPAFKRMFFDGVSDVEDKSLEDSGIHNEVVLVISQLAQKIIAKKRKSFIEQTIPTIMGDRYVEINAIPEKNEYEQIETIILAIRDITDQKIAAESIHKEHKKVKDSINYSKQIQKAIFPHLNLLKDYFREAFILNKPKDVIGGDFPWVSRTSDYIYISAVDCTGHGVPGALMSILTYFIMDKITYRSEEYSPAKILNVLHLFVSRALKQHYSDSKSKDGADIAMCRINLAEKYMEYAGAHRPVFMVRNGELKEIKGDRFPIGGTQYDKIRKRYVNHRIELLEDDIILIFSDGLQDQFGFDQKKNKVAKFGLKGIRKVLGENSMWNMDQLSQRLEERMKEWMGKEKQIDDILVIGVKI